MAMRWVSFIVALFLSTPVFAEVAVFDCSTITGSTEEAVLESATTIYKNLGNLAQALNVNQAITSSIGTGIGDPADPMIGQLRTDVVDLSGNKDEAKTRAIALCNRYRNALQAKLPSTIQLSSLNYSSAQAAIAALAQQTVSDLGGGSTEGGDGPDNPVITHPTVSPTEVMNLDLYRTNAAFIAALAKFKTFLSEEADQLETADYTEDLKNLTEEGRPDCEGAKANAGTYGQHAAKQFHFYRQIGGKEVGFRWHGGVFLHALGGIFLGPEGRLSECTERNNRINALMPEYQPAKDYCGHYVALTTETLKILGEGGVRGCMDNMFQFSEGSTDTEHFNRYMYDKKVRNNDSDKAALKDFCFDQIGDQSYELIERHKNDFMIRAGVCMGEVNTEKILNPLVVDREDINYTRPADFNAERDENWLNATQLETKDPPSPKPLTNFTPITPSGSGANVLTRTKTKCEQFGDFIQIDIMNRLTEVRVNDTPKDLRFARFCYANAASKMAVAWNIGEANSKYFADSSKLRDWCNGASDENYKAFRKHLMSVVEGCTGYITLMFLAGKDKLDKLTWRYSDAVKYDLFPVDEGVTFEPGPVPPIPSAASEVTEFTENVHLVGCSGLTGCEGEGKMCLASLSGDKKTASIHSATEAEFYGSPQAVLSNAACTTIPCADANTRMQDGFDPFVCNTDDSGGGGGGGGGSEGVSSTWRKYHEVYGHTITGPDNQDVYFFKEGSGPNNMPYVFFYVKGLEKLVVYELRTFESIAIVYQDLTEMSGKYNAMSLKSQDYGQLAAIKSQVQVHNCADIPLLSNHTFGNQILYCPTL